MSGGDEDDPTPVNELAVRAALAAYLEGGADLGELVGWLMETCGGARARTAPMLACRIVAKVDKHLHALRAELARLYAEPPCRY